MPHWQPLGAGGSGDPHRPTHQDHVDKAIAAHTQAVIEAGTLFDELRKSPGVATVARELENRIDFLLKGDPFSLALLKIIGTWRNIIEVAPKAAEDKVRRLMGPTLTSITEETQAAP
jgi:hypothetical protein